MRKWLILPLLVLLMSFSLPTLAGTGLVLDTSVSNCVSCHDTGDPGVVTMSPAPAALGEELTQNKKPYRKALAAWLPSAKQRIMYSSLTVTPSAEVGWRM